MMDLHRANMDNLITLWRNYGVAKDSGQGLFCNIGWPHRAWFESSQFDIEALTKLPTRAIFPLLPDAMGRIPMQYEAILLELGWNNVLQQTAMTLALTEYEIENGNRLNHSQLELRKIRTLKDIRLWTEIVSEAFSYQVDVKAINRLRAHDNASLFLVRLQDKPVATAILLGTGKVVGIHQVGVKADYQGQGIAKWLMLELIKKAQTSGAEHLVLQASESGKPLYQKLGFVEQFTINSFSKK